MTPTQERAAKVLEDKLEHYGEGYETLLRSCIDEIYLLPDDPNPTRSALEECVRAMLLWKNDEFGRDRRALYLENIYVGSVVGPHKGKWRAWFSSDADGSEVGKFDTEQEARDALEATARNALQETEK